MKLFNTAYYIAKNERPFSDFNQLCMLQVKNGITLGETYLMLKYLHLILK